jgi:hypothetical protein
MTLRAECDWGCVVSQPLLSGVGKAAPPFDLSLDVDTLRSWIHLSHKQVLFWSVVATPRALQSILSKRCRVLHFVGPVINDQLQIEDENGYAY